jgi:hypothetical protein
MKPLRLTISMPDIFYKFPEESIILTPYRWNKWSGFKAATYPLCFTLYGALKIAVCL